MSLVPTWEIILSIFRLFHYRSNNNVHTPKHGNNAEAKTNNVNQQFKSQIVPSAPDSAPAMASSARVGGIEAVTNLTIDMQSRISEVGINRNDDTNAAAPSIEALSVVSAIPSWSGGSNHTVCICIAVAGGHPELAESDRKGHQARCKGGTDLLRA